MGVDNLVYVVLAVVKAAINAEDSLEDRCRSAMRAAHSNGVVTDEDLQFKGAVAAVYAASTDADEKARIEVELKSLAVLSAAMSGVPVDFDAVEVPENPIGLRVLWLEVTEGVKR